MEAAAHQNVHPPEKGHNKGRGDTAASSTSKAKEVAQGTSSPMARRQALPRGLSSQRHTRRTALKVTEPQLATPAHPPKVIGDDKQEGNG